MEENRIPEEENLDLVQLEDEDGNTMLMEIINNFFYNGNEYVVLTEAHECDCEDCCHEEEEEQACYIMQVVQTVVDGEDCEEFLPVEDDDLYEKLIKVAEANFAEDQELDD